MATLSLSDVNKRYDNGAHAVRGVDMEIADGEFIVFVGPSGCGKSTLLRMVAGLEAITEGQIAIDGRRINDVSPSERDVAMVFQNYALYPHMTVYRNMAYGLSNRKVPKTEIDSIVRQAAATLRIEEFLDRKPHQLSGGQRQRVAMGRAIVRNPKVFLFDEPLSNLDAKLRVQMRIEIKRLQRSIGVTSIYVTHDQIEAMTLADRLAVISEGRIEQMGTPIELYETPATTFVASFIGSPAMNFLPARVADDGGSITLDEGPVLPIPTGTLAGHAGRTLTLGVRPEHLGEEGDDSPIASLEVELIEQLGADTLIYGRLAEGGENLTVRLQGVRTLSPGDTLPIRAPWRHLHLFDAESGARISLG